MSFILGLAGRLESGKNLTADILCDLYPFHQASFANSLREEVSCVTILQERIPEDILMRACEGEQAMKDLAEVLVTAKMGHFDPWEKPTNPTMRRVLQIWGTEYRRSIDPDYWVNRLKASLSPALGYVITDVRFVNEKFACDELWWVHRKLAEAGARLHESESQLNAEDCDIIVDNNGSINDLRVAIAECFKFPGLIS